MDGTTTVRLAGARVVLGLTSYHWTGCCGLPKPRDCV